MSTITCIEGIGNKTYSSNSVKQVTQLDQYRQILNTELQSESSESRLQQLSPDELLKVLRQLRGASP